MPLQPDDDRQLAKTSGRQGAVGSRLLAAAVVLWVAGLVIWLADISRFVGLVLIALGMPTLVAGIALSGSGVVGRRASQQKPFA